MTGSIARPCHEVLDLAEVGAEEGEPEAEVRIGDAVALVLRSRLDREWLVHGDDALLHQRGQGAGQRSRRDVARSATDVAEGALAAADRPQYRACLHIGRELGGQRSLTGDQKCRGRVVESLAKVVHEWCRGGPFIADQWQASRHQVGVKGIGCRQVEQFGHLGRGQRRDDHLGRALVEGSAVAVERLHHRQIGTDADEQDALAGQFAIEGPLEGSFEAFVGCDQIGHLVEDDHAAVVGKRRGQQSERGIPAGELDAGEERGSGQIRCRNLFGEQSQFVARRPSCGREEQVGNVDAVDELLHEAGLADAPASADEERLAGLGVRIGPNALQQPVKAGQLLLPSDEHYSPPRYSHS
jgi:hypothetical protein